METRILLAPTQVMRGMTLVGCGKGVRHSTFAAGAEVLPAYCKQAKGLGDTCAALQRGCPKNEVGNAFAVLSRGGHHARRGRFGALRV